MSAQNATQDLWVRVDNNYLQDNLGFYTIFLVVLSSTFIEQRNAIDKPIL